MRRSTRREGNCFSPLSRERERERELSQVTKVLGWKRCQACAALILLPRKRVQSASHILENCWGHLTSWQDTFPRIGANRHPLWLSPSPQVFSFCFLDIPPRISRPTRSQPRIDIVSHARSRSSLSLSLSLNRSSLGLFNQLEEPVIPRATFH